MTCSLVGDRDDPNNVGSSSQGIVCQGDTGIRNKTYGVWGEEKEKDRRANDSVQAFQNRTTEKERRWES